MEDKQTSSMVGTVDGRHIVFTRTRPDGSEQKYDGWFFEKTTDGSPFQSYRDPIVAGTFTVDGKTQWSCYGAIAELLG